jgi:cell division protein FtsZ
MMDAGMNGVEFVAVNTDAQDLKMNKAPSKIQLGTNLTKGLGAGSKQDIGEAAADESLNDIIDYIKGSNMVFITAGMGGGTGTGASHVIARAAKELNILTVGVVTLPFSYEGPKRMRQALDGLEKLKRHLDTNIVVPNQNLFKIINEKTTFKNSFSLSNDVLKLGVQSVTDLMVRPGLINLDFADVETIMKGMGKAMMGTGEAEGEKRAEAAANAALHNPLIDEYSLRGAKGLLVNITAGPDLTAFEVDAALILLTAASTSNAVRSGPAVILTKSPLAPLKEYSSISGLCRAAFAAASALFSPSASPVPIIAFPIPFIMVSTSAKSKLISPGLTIKSVTL